MATTIRPGVQTAKSCIAMGVYRGSGTRSEGGATTPSAGLEGDRPPPSDGAMGLDWDVMVTAINPVATILFQIVAELVHIAPQY
jgi:hypothetical protein